MHEKQLDTANSNALKVQEIISEAQSGDDQKSLCVTAARTKSSCIANVKTVGISPSGRRQK